MKSPRRPYRKTYCGQLFIKFEGMHRQIHTDGTLLSRLEIEVRKSEGIRCFDKFYKQLKNKKMKYVTLIYPEKVKRIKYAGKADLIRKLYADMKHRQQLYNELVDVLLRFPDGSYYRFERNHVRRMNAVIDAGLNLQPGYGLKLSARGASRLLMRMKYYYHWTNYERLVHKAHHENAIFGHFGHYQYVKERGKKSISEHERESDARFVELYRSRS